MPKSLFSESAGSPIYQLVRDNPKSAWFKQTLEELWGKFKPYASPDFPKKLRTDGEAFERLSWEMLLGAKFLDEGFQLLKNEGDDQPDLCVLYKGKCIWFECTMPDRGNPNSANYLKPRAENGEAGFVDMDKNILRCTSIISEKVGQHKRWLEKKICKEDEPFVIAVHGKHLDISIWDDRPPDIYRAVYPVGDFFVKFTDLASEITTGYTYQVTIKKSNGSDVSKELFANSKNAQITGVLYAENYPDISAAYVPNVFATNEMDLPLNSFCQICKASLTDTQMLLETHNPNG